MVRLVSLKKTCTIFPFKHEMCTRAYFTGGLPPGRNLWDRSGYYLEEYHLCECEFAYPI